MKKLNLDKCKTNREVCDLVSKRIGEITFEDLLTEVDKKFVFMESATKSIYTGLSMNMNVFLHGKGGFGKTEIIKHILDIYKIPYHTIIGYKDMPVDALLGIPDMDKLLNESKYEIKFKESVFYRPGILVGEEFTDILPSTAAVLKDILTERGYRSKNGKVESLVSSMIIAANKSASDMVEDESQRALYEERFPIQNAVFWPNYDTSSYFDFLKKVFVSTDDKMLFFISKLFAYNFTDRNLVISPRTAINVTSTFLTKGLAYIDVFKLDTTYIDKIKREADREFNKLSLVNTLDDIKAEIDQISTSKISKEDLISYYYFIIEKLNDLKVTSNSINEVSELKKTLETNIKAVVESLNKKKDFKKITSLMENMEIKD